MELTVQAVRDKVVELVAGHSPLAKEALRMAIITWCREQGSSLPDSMNFGVVFEAACRQAEDAGQILSLTETRIWGWKVPTFLEKLEQMEEGRHQHGVGDG